MNESLDLRNRILKMRESNNLVLDQAKSESKKIDSSSEFVTQKTETDLNSQENLKESVDNVNFETEISKQSSFVESKKTVNSNLFKKELDNSNLKKEKTTNKQTLNSLFSDNEAQFRMIAEKFNEAVEVILELSNKVKKLEEIVNDLSMKSGKNKKSYSFLSLKTFVLITFTTVMILAFLSFPVDISLIKLIIQDVISSI